MQGRQADRKRKENANGLKTKGQRAAENASERDGAKAPSQSSEKQRRYHEHKGNSISSK